MNQSRFSSFGITVDEERILEAAQLLRSRLEQANLQLIHNVTEFNTHKLGSDESLDSDDVEARDPAIVAADVSAQVSFLRKLKFQYLELNAKDKYVKLIVSDIDDAPMVATEDNKALLARNAEKKEKLKVAKVNLAEMHRDIRTLAPLVEQDYRKVKEAADQANILAQKIIDARLALMRLRKTHPHPRLTVPLADQKLIDQVTEMQNLNDEVQSINKQVHDVKGRVKSGTSEVESLRVERAEAEKAVRLSQAGEDDVRLVPLYNWYIASMSFHRSIQSLHESHAVSENELRLTYLIDSGRQLKSHRITITLIFAPDTRHLASVQILGLDELGVDVGDMIEAHIQVNDVHGVVAAILAMARAAVV